MGAFSKRESGTAPLRKAMSSSSEKSPSNGWIGSYRIHDLGVSKRYHSRFAFFELWNYS